RSPESVPITAPLTCLAAVRRTAVLRTAAKQVGRGVMTSLWNGATGMAKPMLEVMDLTKDYGGTRALDHVSFRVEEGEMVGLLGPNGAGKTTLLSIVCGLLPATSGEVRVCGQPLRDRRALRREIGIVPQEVALYSKLTARENLTFFGELYGMGSAALHQRVD